MLRLSKDIFPDVITVVMDKLAYKVGLIKLDSVGTEDEWVGTYDYIHKGGMRVTILVMRDLNRVLMKIGDGIDRKDKRFWKMEDLDNYNKFKNQLEIWRKNVESRNTEE